MPWLCQLTTDRLTEAELAAIVRLMADACGTGPDGVFDDDDWQYALGGMHLLPERQKHILGHGVHPRLTTTLVARCPRAVSAFWRSGNAW